jgi:hypothetical protein
VETHTEPSIVALGLEVAARRLESGALVYRSRQERRAARGGGFRVSVSLPLVRAEGAGPVR